MEIDRLLELLAARNSVQARLRSDEPIQMWEGTKWVSANYPLTGGQLSRMLGLIAPPDVRPFVHDLNSQYEFDYYHSSGIYRVNAKAVKGHRTVLVTRLDANGHPLRSMDDSDPLLDFQPTVTVGQGTASSIQTPEHPAPTPAAATTQWKLEDAPVEETAPIPPPKRAPAPRTVVSPTVPDQPGVPLPGSPSSAAPSQGPRSLPQTTDQAHWFYGHAGQSMGPHTKEEMAALIASGALLRETMVFDSRVGDWQQAKLSALNGFFPLNTGGEWVNPSVAEWRPQTAGEVKAEKAFVGLIGTSVVGAVILLACWIALAQIRGANKSFDYSQQFATKIEKESPTAPSGTLHNVHLERDDNNRTHYTGTAQYANNYLADVQMDVKQNDFWSRPIETDFTTTPHDFSQELDSLLYNAPDAGRHIDHVTVTHGKDNEYSGVMYFTDRTAKGLIARILSFKSDGSIDDWRYDFIEDSAATGTEAR